MRILLALLEAWLEVETSLAQRRFTWRELASDGSGYILKKVLRPVLDAEAAAQEAPRAPVVLDAMNYDMRDDLPVAVVLDHARRHPA